MIPSASVWGGRGVRMGLPWSILARASENRLGPSTSRSLILDL